MSQAVFCLGCQSIPGTYLGIPMILCGERMGNRHEDNRGMMYLHVETEDKVESPKEEVEVWIHMQFRRRYGENPAILQ